jgi:hypothetical protein
MSSYSLRGSKDGRTRLAVVRQAHHWGGGYLTTNAAFVLSLSKDGRTRRAMPWFNKLTA